MDAEPTKTARFSEVVDKSGRPEPTALWADPEKNPDLMRAVRQERVMTVVQDPSGTKKDFGLIGLLKQKGASFLIFSRSLAEYRNRRVIGINYDLLAQSKAKPLKVKPAAEQKPRKTQPKPPEATPPKPPKQPPRFEVTIRVTVESQFTETVEANTRKQAEEAALTRAKERKPELAAGKTSMRVVAMRKLAVAQ